MTALSRTKFVKRGEERLGLTRREGVRGGFLGRVLVKRGGCPSGCVWMFIKMKWQRVVRELCYIFPRQLLYESCVTHPLSHHTTPPHCRVIHTNSTQHQMSKFKLNADAPEWTPGASDGPSNEEPQPQKKERKSKKDSKKSPIQQPQMNFNNPSMLPLGAMGGMGGVPGMPGAGGMPAMGAGMNPAMMGAAGGMGMMGMDMQATQQAQFLALQQQQQHMMQQQLQAANQKQQQQQAQQQQQQQAQQAQQQQAQQQQAQQAANQQQAQRMMMMQQQAQLTQMLQQLEQQKVMNPKDPQIQQNIMLVQQKLQVLQAQSRMPPAQMQMIMQMQMQQQLAMQAAAAHGQNPGAASQMAQQQAQTQAQMQMQQMQQRLMAEQGKNAQPKQRAEDIEAQILASQSTSITSKKQKKLAAQQAQQSQPADFARQQAVDPTIPPPMAKTPPSNAEPSPAAAPITAPEPEDAMNFDIPPDTVHEIDIEDAAEETFSKEKTSEIVPFVAPFEPIKKEAIKDDDKKPTAQDDNKLLSALRKKTRQDLDSIFFNQRPPPGRGFMGSGVMQFLVQPTVQDAEHFHDLEKKSLIGFHMDLVQVLKALEQPESLHIPFGSWKRHVEASMYVKCADYIKEVKALDKNSKPNNRESKSQPKDVVKDISKLVKDLHKDFAEQSFADAVMDFNSDSNALYRTFAELFADIGNYEIRVCAHPPLPVSCLLLTQK